MTLGLAKPRGEKPLIPTLKDGLKLQRYGAVSGDGLCTVLEKFSRPRDPRCCLRGSFPGNQISGRAFLIWILERARFPQATRRDEFTKLYRSESCLPLPLPFFSSAIIHGHRKYRDLSAAAKHRHFFPIRILRRNTD
jgi:hypothetical protein